MSPRRRRTTRAGCRGSAEEIAKLGVEVTPSVGNFLLLRFPATTGKTAADADRYLSARGFVLRAVHGLRPAGLPADDGRRRRGQPRRRRGAGGVHGGRPVMSERLGPPLGAPLFDAPRAHRRRPDRLFDRPRGAAQECARASSPSPTTRREARERATALELGDEVRRRRGGGGGRGRPRHPLRAGRRRRGGRARRSRRS